jgi:hypothetical protein
VEDLTQTITIFRALIGAGRRQEAGELWLSFGHVLLVDLGAYATVAELLTPLRTTGSPRVLAGLAIAWQLTGQYDKAISQETANLRRRMRGYDLSGACTSLNALSAFFGDILAYAVSSRYDLHAELLSAAGESTAGSLCLSRAFKAVYGGRTKDARSLLARAESLGSASGPWFSEMIEVWRLYLALVADRSLTHDRLADMATRVRSARGRREVARLRVTCSCSNSRTPRRSRPRTSTSN